MPFVDETNKVASAVDAVTSHWKTWAIAGVFVLAAALVIYIVVKIF